MLSLRDYLQSGNFAGLGPGMSVAAMREILGEPDRVGAVGRNSKRSRIYRYGDFEIYTRWGMPETVSSIYVEFPPDGASIRFPKRIIECEWPIVDQCRSEIVERFLEINGIPFAFSDAGQELIVINTGLTFRFDGGLLHSLWHGGNNDRGGKAIGKSDG